MRVNRIILFIVLSILVTSCGSKKGVVTKKSKSKKEDIVKNGTVVEEEKSETEKSSQEVGPSLLHSQSERRSSCVRDSGPGR